MPKCVDRIYVVDDCSTDDTSGRVVERSAKDSRIVLLRHETNSGVGAAIDVEQMVVTLRGRLQSQSNFL
ncbi:MAG: glycosyltransferase [Methanoculleus sp.]|nr:glycosyltransferase [Methanoculleus sp.]